MAGIRPLCLGRDFSAISFLVTRATKIMQFPLVLQTREMPPGVGVNLACHHPSPARPPPLTQFYIHHIVSLFAYTV
jgi:hypothetical protein